MSTLIEAHAPELVLSLVAFLVCGVLYLLVRSLIWAYRDAEARGKPGWMVALLLLLCKWPISLLFWVVLRPPVSAGTPTKLKANHKLT